MSDYATKHRSMEHLQLANEVRLARSQVFADLKNGKVTLAQAFEHEALRTAQIYKVLRARHRWGEERVRRLLVRLGISETREVQFLTERQKERIIEEINRRESNGKYRKEVNE